MNLKFALTLTNEQHNQFHSHLFPGDGSEAVAIALCGRHEGSDEHRMIVHKIHPIPYEQCSVRAPDRITWSTTRLVPLLEQASQRNLAVLKIHSHPSGFSEFSPIDDEYDRDLFTAIHTRVDRALPHVSAVMLPNGRIFGRAIDSEINFIPLSVVKVVGDNLHFWYEEESVSELPDHSQRTAQFLGQATFEMLQNLKVGVVGYSGTGSPLVEALTRSCVGCLVIIEPDVVEHKNRNRIFYTTSKDADEQIAKINVARRSIEAAGFDTRLVTLRCNLFDSTEAIQALAECDIVFGCMDSIDGRYLLNRLATFYSIPYFDIGVKLEADGQGGIDQVCGTIHYIQPGKSSLLSRGVFTLEQVRAASLKRTDPTHYEEQVRSKYIVGIQEERPAVIHVNMIAAGLALDAMLSRLNPYKCDDNSQFASLTFSLVHGEMFRSSEGPLCEVFARHVGRGELNPLLDMPEFTLSKEN